MASFIKTYFQLSLYMPRLLRELFSSPVKRSYTKSNRSVYLFASVLSRPELFLLSIYSLSAAFTSTYKILLQSLCLSLAGGE